MTLSIVTINYNNLVGLRKTIASVLSQTWHDYEWIIIDGGSTDGSRKLIEQTAEKLNSSDFNPLSFWCSEPDKGIYNAMNKGIEHCNGEYVNFMNSGDEFFEANTLEQVFTVQKHADVLYGNTYMYSNDTAWISQAPWPMDIYKIYHHSICHQSAFTKTSILKENKFEVKYQICADYALWVRLVCADCRFEYMNLTVCRYNRNGISSNNTNRMQAERELVKKDIIPGYVSKLIEEYAPAHQYQSETTQIKNILQNGGLTSALLLCFLRVAQWYERVKLAISKI